MGVAKIVEDVHYTPDITRKYSVADMITGYGVSEAVRHYYEIYGGDLKGKRAIIQGWGNVGSAAAYYLAQAGARIVGIVDRAGGLIVPEGLSFEDVRRLFLDKDGNKLVAEGMMPFQATNEQVWDVEPRFSCPAPPPGWSRATRSIGWSPVAWRWYRAVPTYRSTIRKFFTVRSTNTPTARSA